VAGVKIPVTELDWPGAQREKEDGVARLTGGVAGLLRHNGVTVHRGTAFLLSGSKVRVGTETLEADAVVLATGSVNAKPGFPGSELPGVIDSTAALSLARPPESMVIVGGGVIGVEFAALYHALGTKITILEMLPGLLPPVDEEIAERLRGMLEAGGVCVRTGARLDAVEKSEAGLCVRFEQGGRAQNVTAEKVLVAVGRRPNTAGLGLEALGVATDRGAVVVDGHFRTNLPGLYAVGDCNAKQMLAHAAMAQGIAAVEHIMGAGGRYNGQIMPSCIYASPEVAGVGMTEKQVRGAGIEYAVGRFDLSGNGKALIEAEEGMIKIIADKKLGEVLGVHMIGPRVTEMIAEAALCMRLEGTVEDIVRTVHAHPTVSEAMGEAAMAVFGKPIHGI
jgi:dihydrolipoamide dehydrogenase